MNEVSLKTARKDFDHARHATGLDLWISKHRAEHDAEPGWEVNEKDAAADFVSWFSPKPDHAIGRVWRRKLL